MQTIPRESSTSSNRTNETVVSVFYTSISSLANKFIASFCSFFLYACVICIFEAKVHMNKYAWVCMWQSEVNGKCLPHGSLPYTLKQVSCGSQSADSAILASQHAPRIPTPQATAGITSRLPYHMFSNVIFILTQRYLKTRQNLGLARWLSN